MKNSKGFTLIELMIVVAILAILAAIIYPAYLDYQARGVNPATGQPWDERLFPCINNQRYINAFDANGAVVSRTPMRGNHGAEYQPCKPVPAAERAP